MDDKNTALHQISAAMASLMRAEELLLAASSTAEWLGALRTLFAAQTRLMKAQVEIGKVVEARF